MKEQGKNLQDQINGDRQSSKKRIQNNDSEDDPGPWKKNGGKDREDAKKCFTKI